MGGFHGAGRGGVGGLEARNEFTGREDLDLEIAVRRLGHVFRQYLRTAVDRVERLGERRGEAPVDLRVALRERRGGEHRGGRAADAGDTGLLDE